ncbi:macrophage mannose receptor 1-like [Colossoma macropomum]|uniref:macrophage mannose receptor 1-like n=1 Tax=Colossoma macropomum TaxID=42526 RepID=UPI0018641FD5|nr:macrophage mannose receptor 1-like [Colossoma macropomum]
MKAMINQTLLCVMTKTRQTVLDTYLINETKSWRVAQSYCREHYTDLASVRNQTENEEIWKSATHSITGVVWIGLFNDSWTWSDQSNSSFRNWPSNQPFSQDWQQNCAAVSMTDQGLWRDVNCETKNPFICHENKLILINQNLAWREALRYCRVNHVDLVSVHSEEIQLWVKEVAQKASTEHVWLGLRHTCTLSLWFWLSGEFICYQNWAPGSRTGGEDCSSLERTGAVQSRGGQQWVSLPEDQKLNFICTTYED